jgi:hypothetical protein
MSSSGPMKTARTGTSAPGRSSIARAPSIRAPLRKKARSGRRTRRHHHLRRRESSSSNPRRTRGSRHLRKLATRHRRSRLVHLLRPHRPPAHLADPRREASARGARSRRPA